MEKIPRSQSIARPAPADLSSLVLFLISAYHSSWYITLVGLQGPVMNTSYACAQGPRWWCHFMHLYPSLYSSCYLHIWVLAVTHDNNKSQYEQALKFKLDDLKHSPSKYLLNSHQENNLVYFSWAAYSANQWDFKLQSRSFWSQVTRGLATSYQAASSQSAFASLSKE